VAFRFAVANRLKQLAGVFVGLGFIRLAFALVVAGLVLLLGLGFSLVFIPLLGLFGGRL
jgi:hypothetical protein